MLQYLTKLRRKRGFTLIELVIVIVVLAIIAAIAVPALANYIDKAKEKETIQKAKEIMKAAQVAFSNLYAEGASLAITVTDESNKKQDTQYWGTVDGIEDSTVWSANSDVALYGNIKKATIVHKDQWSKWSEDCDYYDATDFAKSIMKTAGYDGTPYSDTGNEKRFTNDDYPALVMIGCGSSEYYLAKDDVNDVRKAYTVYFVAYKQAMNTKTVYYDGTQWTTDYPWDKGVIDENNNVKINGESIPLQFYFLSYYYEWGTPEKTPHNLWSDVVRAVWG